MAANLQLIEANRSETMPNHSTVVINGPVDHEHLEAANAMEKNLSSCGYNVINPARTASELAEAKGVPMSDPSIQQTTLKKTLLDVARSGGADVVNMPGAEESKTAQMIGTMVHNRYPSSSVFQGNGEDHTLTPVNREDDAHRLSASLANGVNKEYSAETAIKNAARASLGGPGEEQHQASAHPLVMPSEHQAEGQGRTV